MPDDQTGLIIGASSGIGQSIHEVLAKTHSDIVWLTPSPYEVDVRDGADIQGLVRSAGPFTHIVYSAGVNHLSWVSQLSNSHSLADTWLVNCAGFVRLMGWHMATYPNAHGSALAVSSDAATRPMRGSTSYCSSKAALNAAVKCMARELAPAWRVNAISPGITDGTGMARSLDARIPSFRGWSTERARDYETSQIPMSRRADVSEIARVAVDILTGPEYLTGSIVEVNGGR